MSTEFIGTSVCSFGDGSDLPPWAVEAMDINPHMRFINDLRGYLRVTVDSHQWRTDLRALPYVRRPDADVFTRASFVIENGKPGVEIDSA